jgi:hypothetical protein
MGHKGCVEKFNVMKIWNSEERFKITDEKWMQTLNHFSINNFPTTHPYVFPTTPPMINPAIAYEPPSNVMPSNITLPPNVATPESPPNTAVIEERPFRF